MKRIDRELKTLKLMVAMYCRHHHGGDRLCADCQALYAYARERSLRCRFGEDKPACSDCRVHCYKPQMRARIREVMKFAGPRMIRSHPLLALRHLWDRRRDAKTS